MAIVKVSAKKWGNSLGILIPKEVAESEKIREGQKLEIVIMKPNNVLKETFGTAKGLFKEPTQKIKDELRKELYDD